MNMWYKFLQVRVNSFTGYFTAVSALTTKHHGYTVFSSWEEWAWFSPNSIRVKFMCRSNERNWFDFPSPFQPASTWKLQQLNCCQSNGKMVLVKDISEATIFAVHWLNEDDALHLIKYNCYHLQFANNTMLVRF
jgi:hypothetical protein